MQFSTFIPLYNNKKPDTRYFVHFENGKKKELKQHNNNIYYFCVDRKRTFVKIDGSLYHRKFTLLGANELCTQ